MNYRELNDNELISYIAEKNEDAEEIIYAKYEPLINSVANKMYSYCKNTGLELSDLLQEGRIGLSQAISTYKEEKDTLFYTYAKTCIERRVISLIISSNRMKHQFLNSAISLDKEVANTENARLDEIIKDPKETPEEILINNEFKEEWIQKVKEKLNDFEIQVFDLKISGFDYKEIANILDTTPKKIDNTLQRIKLKIKTRVS